MPRWRDLLTGAALIAGANPATASDLPAVLKGTAGSAAIVAGGKACVGTTVDPSGVSARLAGWAPLAATDLKALNTTDSAVTRDNVVLVYKAGIDGGCAVIARIDASFDTTAFSRDLGTAIGVSLPLDASSQPVKPVKVDLPNGELMAVVISPKGETTDQPPMVILALANQARAAKKES